MKKQLFIILFFSFIAVVSYSQQQTTTIKGYLVPVCVYKGDTIPNLQLPNIYIFKPLKFKSEKERQEYYRLVRNVKKTLPLAHTINHIIIETYEYMETLPDKKAKENHLKLVEKGLKEQYTPVMKKLTYTQGKLLIKLIDRQTNSSSYELIKAFMGPFKAGFYQTFAALLGASLKREYHPDDEDQLTERVVLLVESGQI